MRFGMRGRGGRTGKEVLGHPAVVVFEMISDDNSNFVMISLLSVKRWEGTNGVSL